MEKILLEFQRVPLTSKMLWSLTLIFNLYSGISRKFFQKSMINGSSGNLRSPLCSMSTFPSAENTRESQLIPGLTNRYWSWWEGVISSTERQENLTGHWTRRDTGDCAILLPYWSERRERITSPINYKIANLTHGASGNIPGKSKKSGFDLLLAKLESYGIKENILQWFKSYLSGRSNKKQNYRIFLLESRKGRSWDQHI